MLALHNECLTRRYLLNRLNFLEGLLGFGLGMSCAFKGLRKLGPLRLRVTLQGLIFLDEIPELLLNLADSGLMLIALDALLGRFAFWPRTTPSSGPPLRSWPLAKFMTILLFDNHIFLYQYIDGVSLTFVLFELPLGKAELFLGPLKVPLQYGDLRSTCDSGQ